MLARIQIAIVGAMLIVGLPTHSTLAANPRTSNPSNSDPDQALAVHGDELSVKLQAECYSRYMLLVKFVPPIVKREAAGQTVRKDPDKLAEARLALHQLPRLARNLAQLGEPAGHEFQLRATAFQIPLNSIIGAYNSTPAGVQNSTAVRQRLTRMDRERLVTQKRLSELVQKKQYEEAEVTWFAYYDKLLEHACFLTPKEIDPYTAPFAEIQVHISTTMAMHRLAKGKEVLTTRRDSQRPNTAALVAQISATAQALAKSDRAMIDEGALSGPEAFSHFMSAWQKMHAGAIRCQGLTWAIHTLMPSMGIVGEGAVPVTMAPISTANDPALEEYRARSASQISQALAGLVEADATRVTASDAPALYLAWLDAAAPHVGRVPNDVLSRALEPALLKLAGRSPELLAQVMAYDEATRDLLRWKRRTAEAAASPFVSQQPTLESTCQKAFFSDKTTGYIGLFAAENPLIHPTFLVSAPALLPFGSERLLKQSVILNAGQGLAGGKSNVTRLRMREFATLKPNPASLAAAVATLEAELYVTAEQPPLTLISAAALRSLQLGDFVTCGGEVSGVTLEGWLTRLAGLPDAAWPIFPLGDLPVAPEAQGQSSNTIDKAVVRCEIEPKWLRHEYVIVPMAPPPAAAVGDSGAEAGR